MRWHQPGEIIADRYEIVGILGEGNSGVTYQATDLKHPQQIALKAMSLQNISDWKLVELFEREAEILAKLDHPQIPSYLDYFQIDTAGDCAFYIAQELAPGKSLAEWVESGWHLPEKEIREIAIALLKILVYLHLQKPAVIHRDIKPQNIIRSDDGKIFLVDFGAVRHTYHNTMMRGSTVVGTYGYMAPEQFRGRAFPATDLYGLGATLLYLFTHRSPGELPTNGLRIDFRSHIAVSEEFGDWLEHILEPDMSERFTSAASALEALQPKKISLTKSISWQQIIAIAGLGIGGFWATKSLSQQKYAVFNNLGLTPYVHSAIYQEAIDTRVYLTRGGNINGADKQGKTLLHYAVEKNNLDLIKYLIVAGADIDLIDIQGNTALYRAIATQNKALIALLKDNNAKLNGQDLQQLGLDLHANLCDEAKVSFLLSHDADVDFKNASGLTPLLRIVNTECEKSQWDRSQTQVVVTRLLIQAGADVDAQDSTGKTPLHLIKTKHRRYDSAITRLLIDGGARLNIRDRNGQSPLHAATSGKYDTLKLLVNAGANVNAQDNNGRTPLHLAAKKSGSINGLETFLVKSGADPNIADNNGKPTPYFLTKRKWQ